MPDAITQDAGHYQPQGYSMQRVMLSIGLALAMHVVVLGGYFALAGGDKKPFDKDSKAAPAAEEKKSSSEAAPPAAKTEPAEKKEVLPPGPDTPKSGELPGGKSGAPEKPAPKPGDMGLDDVLK